MAVAVPTKPVGKTVAKAAPVAAAKPVAKKAAGNRVEFDVRVQAPGVIKTIGVVDSVSPGMVIFSHKRHGSSKQVLTPIPLNKIIFVRGSLNKGQKAEIVYQDDRAPIMQFRHAELSGYDAELDMQKGVTQEGHPFFVKPGYFSAVTTTDVAAPTIEVGKKFA